MPQRTIVAVFMFVFLVLGGMVASTIDIFFVRAFDGTTISVRDPWLWAVLLCILNFIIVTLVVQRSLHAMIRVWYRVSAALIGLCAYLFFGTVVGTLCLLLAPPCIDTFIGWSVLLITLMITVYGLQHARTITVTQYTVALDTMPASWKNKRIVWFSDVHVGPVYDRTWVASIVQTVNALDPAFVCIIGDLFDGTKAGNVSDEIAPLAQISAPYGVYAVTGNHEEFDTASEFIDAMNRANVRVLMNESVDLDGLQLVGVDYKEATTADGFRAALRHSAYDHTLPAILLKHEPKHLDIAEDMAISLQLSGHTHLGQMWPLGYIAQLVYRGYAYGQHMYKHMNVITSSGAGTWGPPLRAGTASEIVVITLV